MSKIPLSERVLASKKWRGAWVPAMSQEAISSEVAKLEAQTAWHPFPEEKPERDGTYWVSVRYGEKIKAEGEDVYCDGKWESDDTVVHVIAWMHLPEPYEATDAD